LTTPQRNLALAFKRPMIFPDLIELRLKDRLSENQTRVFFFGGEYAQNVMLGLHEVRLYQLLVEWEGNLPIKVEVSLAQRGFKFEEQPAISVDNEEDSSIFSPRREPQKDLATPRFN